MWQALETKARFIAQVITGESAVRRAEDIGSQELSYAEVKAIASGNPAVLTLAEADAELKRLAILKKNHADEQYLARRSIRELPDAINRLTTRVADLAQDRATLAAHAGDPITIGGQAYAEQDVLKPLGKQLNALPDKVHETRPVPLGTYRGLRFGLVLYPHGAPDTFLEGAATRHASLSRDSHGPRAVLNALDRLAGTYDAQAATARKDLAIAEGQLRDYQARLGQPFTHDAYLAELTDLRDELKAALSEAAPQSLPPAAEVAQRIQALKAAHVVEATPERPGTRSTRTAEEPVTTRIRRRGAVPALQPMVEFPPPPAEPAGWEAADAPGQAAEPTLAEISLPRLDVAAAVEQERVEPGQGQVSPERRSTGDGPSDELHTDPDGRGGDRETHQEEPLRQAAAPRHRRPDQAQETATD